MKAKLPSSMTTCDALMVTEDECIVNGEEIQSENASEKIRKWVLDPFQNIEKCPYCSTLLITADYEFTNDEEYHGQTSTLWSCINCAYWQCFFNSYYEGPPLFSNLGWYAFISKMREFDEKLPNSCDTELAVAIRRNQKLWHTMNPSRLEKLVAAIFKANYADCEAMHVGRPGDGGVDVIFVDSEKHQWLIQVKRRENSKASEGASAIRNLLGAFPIEGVFRGIVVSTADHFTYRALDAVNRADKNVGYKVELIDRGKLDRLLDPLIPQNPWFKALIDNDLPKTIAKSFLGKLTYKKPIERNKQLTLFDED